MNISKVNIVISGAGPAGMASALEALDQGHQVTLLEKRAEDVKGLFQSVILNENNTSFLKRHGIYQDLLNSGKIYPEEDGYIVVRLGDLTKSFRKTAEQRGAKICYQTQIEEISHNGTNIDIRLNSGKTLSGIDLLINAEGYHSKINELVHNRRIEVLHKLPVIISILQEDRPAVKDLYTFAIYAKKSLRNLALSIYYHTLYFFKALIFKEHFFNKKRQIAAAITLTTPGQNQVSFGFSKEMSEKLLALSEKVKNQKTSEKELADFVRHWTYLAFAEVNCCALLSKIGSLLGVTLPNFTSAPFLPLSSYYVTFIQSDYVEHPSIQVEEGAILNVGDSLATMDPTTGLGCNHAIEYASYTKDVIEALEKQTSLSAALNTYNFRSKRKIARAHEAAKELRLICRPDAV
jgi:2-polyprenyl-6-methoxyphenol hydroxylase-like FAD-dependent oxidoreductase